MSQDQDTLGSSSDGSRFRISSKQLFLTYPRCDLSPKDLGLELLQLLIQNKPKYIHVTQELHKDGFPHLHALVQLEKKLFTRRQTFFDQFLHGTKFHPNIQPARDASKVLGYITKQNGEEYIFGKPTLPKKKKTTQEGRDQRMRAIIESSTSKQEYLSMVRKEFPFDWATRLMQFEYSASSLFPEPPVEYTSPFPVDQLLCPEDITEIINSEWFQHGAPGGRPRSIYICGPTRTGKTTWARSLGRHNYYNSVLDFTHYDPQAEYNVIDDVPFKYCPQWKALVGAQRDYIVNPKYGKKKKIKGGIPSIILTNDDEDWLGEMKPAQAEYLHANSHVHYMYEGTKFYKAEAAGQDV
uniref:Replication-associated protein n=1 Tax=Eragrostis minor streak virus TaxID=1030595 RepID=A0A1C6ZUM7_9GEMI|nr:replication-associated protein [Eragrostis minor streak virus]